MKIYKKILTIIITILILTNTTVLADTGLRPSQSNDGYLPKPNGSKDEIVSKPAIETPDTGGLGEYTPNNNHSVDEVISEAKDFINTGKLKGNKISGTNLQAASNTLYNILLTIGIFLSVAVGMYLGIKFMLSSAEDKAKVKEALVPYIAGCVVIFGAFIIWKLAIMLFGGIA